MKKILFSVSLLVAGLFCAAVIGLSQDNEVAPVKGKGPCRDDVAKFCKDVKTGGGRIWACLKSNEAGLTQSCKDTMAKAREKRQDFIKACSEDAKKFCKGIPRGKGRVVACLKSHEAELAGPCKAFFKKN